MPNRGRRAPRDPGEDRIPDVEGEGGRGLFLVAALSACWDWYLTQEPAGRSSGVSLRPNGPNVLKSADRLRRYCSGGCPVRCRYDRLW